ncbi:MAG: hypothetical protein P1V20_29065 [Verrucomicrobiales bacterium]|nr:hypothetical protein [Verrucomicrobiales bacterium]
MAAAYRVSLQNINVVRVNIVEEVIRKVGQIHSFATGRDVEMGFGGVISGLLKWVEKFGDKPVC